MELSRESEIIALRGRCRGCCRSPSLTWCYPRAPPVSWRRKRGVFLGRFRAAKVLNTDIKESGLQQGGEPEVRGAGWAAWLQASRSPRGVQRLLPLPGSGDVPAWGWAGDQGLEEAEKLWAGRGTCRKDALQSAKAQKHVGRLMRQGTAAACRCAAWLRHHSHFASVGIFVIACARAIVSLIIFPHCSSRGWGPEGVSAGGARTRAQGLPDSPEPMSCTWGRTAACAKTACPGGGSGSPHNPSAGRKVLPPLRRGRRMKRASPALSNAASSHKGL